MLHEEIFNLQAKLASAEQARKHDAEYAGKAAERLQLLEAVLDVVPVGVVVADTDGKIFMGNDQIEIMLKHPVFHSENAEEYGEWVSFHKDGRQVKSEEYPLSRIIRDGEEAAEVEVHYQRGDKSKFWVRIIGKPVTDANGKRIGAAVALIDIDQRIKLMEQQELLIGELNHRVKNAFSVVKAIVSQSLRKAEVSDIIRETVDERLQAYANAHAQLVGSEFDKASVGAICDNILSHISANNIETNGPDMQLPTRQGMALSMALYELATNAVKHGCLSNPDGKVKLVWNITGPEDSQQHIIFNWQERGGPQVVEPEREGFGSLIVKQALEAETGGQVSIQFMPEGLEWTLTMPCI